jgi:uncharacterized 2Fe-2S/4Fe-4S cluster protein (DUF4445 family)
MPVVEIDRVVIEAEAGASLFECAERGGVRVPTSCRKNGKCRECLVEVTEGAVLLSPRTEEEAHLRGTFRLSCRARVSEGPGAVRCHTLRRGSLRIAEHGTVDLDRTAPHDPAVRRDGAWVLLDGEPLVQAPGPLYGVALDIGTTTVVARLLDLETASVVATASFENPQRFGGSDIMARIAYDCEHRGRLLQRTLIGYLGHAIEDFPCDPHHIYEVTVAGNSTMRDLFFGLPVESIGQKPYRSTAEHALSTTAGRLRLPIFDRARVYGLPLVACHVGADAAAAMLSTGIAHDRRTAVLMDIGTNTEVIARHGDRIVAASCPAGPAFEGGGIACGMPGMDGAIERVRIDEAGGVELGVIGGGPALGICGSGIVESIGELLRLGRIDEYGRFVDGADRFLLAPEVFLSEADLSEIAQAKGANVAGVQIAMKSLGIEPADVEVFYLAGGFGRHVDVNAARRIGLIPDLPNHRIRQPGNAAIEGAAAVLCSVSLRRELEAVVRGIEHLELETDPDFFDHFVDGCLYRPIGSSLCRT